MFQLLRCRGHPPAPLSASSIYILRIVIEAMHLPLAASATAAVHTFHECCRSIEISSRTPTHRIHVPVCRMSDARHDEVGESLGVSLETHEDKSSFLGPEVHIVDVAAGQEQEQEQVSQEQEQEQQQSQQGRLPRQPRTHIAIAEAPDNDLSRAKVVSAHVSASWLIMTFHTRWRLMHLQPSHLDGAPLAAVLTLLLERRKRVELNMYKHLHTALAH
jgi:hypothetical protein